MPPFTDRKRPGYFCNDIKISIDSSCLHNAPEYNPVEIFWRWIKPKGCGFSAFGGINQLISRFKKYVWHYNNKTLCKSTIVQLQSIRWNIINIYGCMLRQPSPTQGNFSPGALVEPSCKSSFPEGR